MAPSDTVEDDPSSVPAMSLVFPRMSSAARSAIIIVGALLFPATRVCMMEASTTRRPSTPRWRKPGSPTDCDYLPIWHVPTDRKNFVEGKSVSVLFDFFCCRLSLQIHIKTNLL